MNINTIKNCILNQEDNLEIMGSHYMNDMTGVYDFCAEELNFSGELPEGISETEKMIIIFVAGLSAHEIYEGNEVHYVHRTLPMPIIEKIIKNFGGNINIE